MRGGGIDVEMGGGGGEATFKNFIACAVKVKFPLVCFDCSVF